MEAKPHAEHAETEAGKPGTDSAAQQGPLHADVDKLPVLRPVKIREVQEFFIDASSNRITECAIAMMSAVDKKLPAASKQPPPAETAISAVDKKLPAAPKQLLPMTMIDTALSPLESKFPTAFKQPPAPLAATQTGTQKYRRLATPIPLPPSPTYEAQEARRTIKISPTYGAQEARRTIKAAIESGVEIESQMQIRPQPAAVKPADTIRYPGRQISHSEARKQPRQKTVYRPPPFFKTSQQARSGSKAGGMPPAAAGPGDRHMAGVQTLRVRAGGKQGPLLGSSAADGPETVYWVSTARTKPAAASWTACCAALALHESEPDFQDQASDCLSECAVAGSTASSVNPLDFLLPGVAESDGNEEPDAPPADAAAAGAGAAKTSPVKPAAPHKGPSGQGRMPTSAPLTAESVRALNADITAAGVHQKADAPSAWQRRNSKVHGGPWAGKTTEAAAGKLPAAGRLGADEGGGAVAGQGASKVDNVACCLAVTAVFEGKVSAKELARLLGGHFGKFAPLSELLFSTAASDDKVSFSLTWTMHTALMPL